VPGGDAGTAPLHPDVTRAFCQLWMLALCERLEPGAQAGIGRILSAPGQS
jgi:hypothetical protein